MKRAWHCGAGLHAVLCEAAILGNLLLKRFSLPPSHVSWFSSHLRSVSTR